MKGKSMGLQYRGQGNIPTTTDTIMLSIKKATNLSAQDASSNSTSFVGVPQTGQYSDSGFNSFPHFLQKTNNCHPFLLFK
jgi:hypothetical protein